MTERARETKTERESTRETKREREMERERQRERGGERDRKEKKWYGENTGYDLNTEVRKTI